MNETMTQSEGFPARCKKVLEVAQRLQESKPDWVTFFRETLGVKGAARSVFPSQEEYVMFEQSSEFSEIQNMVALLRTGKPSGNRNEATKVITVRLPESLHEALKAEATDHKTSMNKLCISKLLQVLSDNEEAEAAARAASEPARTNAAPVNPTPSPATVSSQSPNFRSTYAPPQQTGGSDRIQFGQ